MNNILIQLKDAYLADTKSFDFSASMYLSGPGNKTLRQQIMECLTGAKLPATKCGFHAVVDNLKISFDQTTLF